MSEASGAVTRRGAWPRFAVHPAVAALRRSWGRDLIVPGAIVLVNAIAFLIVRPGVNDLWAARARANAVGHGVGLSYWFAWFSGGTTPASYSILSPYVTWLITPEVGIALAAVATVVLATIAVRGTEHPLAASLAAVATTCINLWEARVPFVMASAFAVGSLLAVRRRRVVSATVLAVLSLLFSPVAGAFLGLALVAAALVKQIDRHMFIVPAVSLLVGGGLIVLIFGSPGTEPISVGLAIGMIGALVGLLLVWPSRVVRVVILISIPLVVVIALLPNGMGSNFARFIWYCLPVAVLAFTPGRRVLLSLATTPVLVAGGIGLVGDLHQASLPASNTHYYDSLITSLVEHSGTTGSLDLLNYRVEVVDDGTHAADFALLNHAQLARGWETQADLSLNSVLDPKGAAEIPADSYYSWLLRNAVGYVALNRKPPKITPEVALVTSHPRFLQAVWQNDEWTLYRVSDPQSIAEPPATILGFSQNSLIMYINCACRVTVRTYWSTTLSVHNSDPNGPKAQLSPTVSPTSSPTKQRSWTDVTTAQSGYYTLQG